MVAASADLPIELCNLVLDFLVHLSPAFPGAGERLNAHDAHLHKQTLSSCALVCRTWSLVCQKRIFAYLRLRSQEEYQHLMKISQRKGSCVRECVEDLVLRLTPLAVGDAGDAPWIHQLSVQIRPRVVSVPCPHRHSRHGGHTDGDGSNRDLSLPGSPFPNLVSISLELCDDVWRFRGGLTRALPRHQPAFVSVLNHLSLMNVRLGAIGEVLNLAIDLPLLHWLYCYRVSWTRLRSQEPDLNAVTPRRRSRSRGRVTCEVEQCEENEAVVVLAYAINARRQCGMVLADKDVRTMTIMLAAMISLIAADNPTYRVASAVENGILAFNIFKSDAVLSRPVLLLPIVSFIFSPTYDNTSDTQTHCLAGLALSFRCADDEHDALAVSSVTDLQWDTVDATLSQSFAGYPIVIDHPSGDDLALFAKQISESKMERVNKDGRVLYVVWNRKNQAQARWKLWTPQLSPLDIEKAREFSMEELQQMYGAQE